MTLEHEPAGYCPHCGYRIDPGRCPECGVEVARPVSRSPRSRSHRIMRVGIVILACAVVVTGGRYAAPWLMREYWPTGQLCSLAAGQGNWAQWARAVLRYRLNERMLQEQAAYQAREKAISAKLESLGVEPGQPGAAALPEWAGRYMVIGGSSTETLSLCPGAGFVYSWVTSQRGEYFNHGTIESVTGDSIRLVPAITLQLPHELRMYEEYVRVRWGDWRLLIPLEEMPAFCDAVRNAAPATPYFYLASHPHDDPPKEPLPCVPARWQQCLAPAATP